MRIVLAALVLSGFFGTCFYRTASRVTLISNSLPLTFKAEGDQKVSWIWIQGPLQNEREPSREIPAPDDPEKIIIWRIEPAAENGIRLDVPISQIPAITYGQVPPGWEQVMPKSGAPPALLDGYVYYIGVSPGPDLCVFVKDGKIQPYEDPEPGPLCGKQR